MIIIKTSALAKRPIKGYNFSSLSQGLFFSNYFDIIIIILPTFYLTLPLLGPYYNYFIQFA